MRLLAHESAHWLDMNTDIENTVNQCATASIHMQKKKTILKNLPTKPWEIVGADIFLINKETLLCIVDYYSKFPVVKRVDGLSADDFIKATSVVQM